MPCPPPLHAAARPRFCRRRRSSSRIVNNKRVPLAPPSLAEPPREDDGSGRPRWSERARWLALAVVPSSLLLSVTTYVTTDILALPLLREQRLLGGLVVWRPLDTEKWRLARFTAMLFPRWRSCSV